MTAQHGPKKPMVVVEDNTLLAMAGNTAFVKEFPFLRDMQQRVSVAPSGCGGCRARDPRREAFNNARKSLASMDDSKKRRLCELLGATQVKVMYRDAQKRTQRVTF